MSKYKSRQMPITKSEGLIDNDWLKKLEQEMYKDAVQPRNDRNLHDQINHIMNGKSKFRTVEEAVKDMQARSGLTAYLEKMNKMSSPEAEGQTKKASFGIEHVKDDTPIVIKKFPTIKNTIVNYIESTRGNLPIPAIIDKAKSLHKNDVSNPNDWEDVNLMKLVSKLNLEAKSRNYKEENNSNLGKIDLNDNDIDQSNLDAFHSLNPAKNI